MARRGTPKRSKPAAKTETAAISTMGRYTESEGIANTSLGDGRR